MLMTRLVRTWEALDLLTNKLKSRSIILVRCRVDTINTQTTHEFQEVTQKIYGMHTSWCTQVSS